MSACRQPDRSRRNYGRMRFRINRRSSSEPEGIAQANRDLRGLRFERRAGNESALTEGNEDFVARPVFPAIARRESEAAADVVELHLRHDLHVGREIDAAAGGKNVDRDIAGGQIDEGRDVARGQLEEWIWPKGQREIRFEVG